MTPQPTPAPQVPELLSKGPEQIAASFAQATEVPGRSSQRQLVLASLLAAPDRGSRHADGSRRR